MQVLRSWERDSLRGCECAGRVPRALPPVRATRALPPVRATRALPPVRATTLALLAAFVVSGQAAESTASSREGRQLVAELGLVESSVPIREQPSWRPPAFVLVWRPPPDELPELQEAAPAAKVVAVATAEEYVRLAPRADVVLGPCSPAMISAAQRLRWLQTFTAGMENCVSQPRLRDPGVLLTNMQRIGGHVMADHAMAMVLAHSRRLPEYLAAQNRGRWLGDGEVEGAFGLSGKTMFVAGLGGTGLEVAKRASAFGMRVIGTRRTKREAPAYVAYAGLPGETEKLLAEADVVVNALPLTDATRNLFDARLFAAMKNGAFFVNVGRGGSVVTADLVHSLRSGKLAGAGLDVVSPEPLPAGHPLWGMPNVLVTPHVATDADEFRYQRWLLARENLRRYAAGEKMLSVVDPQRGY